MNIEREKERDKRKRDYQEAADKLQRQNAERQQILISKKYVAHLSYTACAVLLTTLGSGGIIS
jgi:hypothetical protein